MYIHNTTFFRQIDVTFMYFDFSDPVQRISGFAPETAALADFGDALQTVSEQILKKTKLKPNIARQLIQ